MAFITEDDIERATIAIFKKDLGYAHLNCIDKENDCLKRDSLKTVFDKKRMKAVFTRLNPSLPTTAIDQAIEYLTGIGEHTTLYNANLEFYECLRNGVEVQIRNAQNLNEKQQVRLIDYQNPADNDFLLISQCWIEGILGDRRPDLLIFINGMPLIFIELKRSDKPLRHAYEDNLMRYRDVIPQLFIPNVACILSNGAEAKMGAFNASFTYFKDWFRNEEDKDTKNVPNKQRIKSQQTALEYLVRSFCQKETLIDFIENFVLFERDKQAKIIAQNHQYLGVNNTIEAFEKARISTEGTIGTFWHTQGSGKSYSMVFFTEKLRRKLTGDFTFLIITDRDDLDRQIHKNYLKVGKIRDTDKVRPGDSKTLRDYLKGNHRYIFTLIHKFRPEVKGQDYPVLSTREDIIVIADEAHRTQYADLAENMRKGLPHAKYLAFTGTPLIQSGITSQYFGEVISEYNFAQSIEDEATVPLYYNKRVPQVQIVNEDLQQEFEAIVQTEDLSEEQMRQIERKFSKEYEVIKRDDRLETIAKDIVNHFIGRGYLGKGMVISIDKFTAVAMFDKVSFHWNEKMKALQKMLLKEKGRQEREELKAKIDYMKSTEMAVVISAEDAEEDKFAKQGLLIKPHRDKINARDKDNKGIEDYFKSETHPLRLVFVCSMWLTGFDAPSVSTLYLDKPMQNHTLMQTIARANRITANTIMGVSKICGEVIDYYGVFRNLKKALADYAQGSQGSGVQETEIVKPQDYLKELLKQSLAKTQEYCLSVGVDAWAVLKEKDINKRVALAEQIADSLLINDETKKTFIVHQNTVSNLYAACKPEIIAEKDFKPQVEMLENLRGVIDRKRQIGDVSSASDKITELLNRSVLSAEDGGYYIEEAIEIDLSKLDYDKLREEFAKTPLKHIAITDLRELIDKKLGQMLRVNPSRINFAERYEQLVKEYNSGSMTADMFAEELAVFMQDLSEEDERHIRENLTENELVIYDLLKKSTLTQAEEQQVKLASQTLLARLRDTKDKILVTDWHKTHQTRLQVQTAIDQILDRELPPTYDTDTFQEKVLDVYKYIFVNRGQFVA